MHVFVSPSLVVPLPRVLVLGGAVLLGAVTPLFACGPWLPEQILASGRVSLRTPVGDYAQEVLALTEADGAPPLPPGLTRLPAAALQRLNEGDEASPEQPPPDGELAELREALALNGVPAEKRDELASAYQAFRAELAKEAESARQHGDTAFRFDEHVRAMRAEAAPPGTEPFALPPALSGALPGEWVDYLEGAHCFWRKDLAGARAAWERLLARPQAQRLFFSVRAAYMLARIEDAPTDAAEDRARRYQRVRVLRADGCRDALNLASDSLGWEGRVALDSHDFPTAIRLYYLQAVSGAGFTDPMASSLRTVAEETLKEGPGSETMATAARDPFLRRVVTLYLACRRRFASEEPDGTPYPSGASEPEESWLKALAQENVDAVREATPIAWSAYKQGDYAQAAAWLEKAPAADPLALWLRAKLALRDGRSGDAAKFFGQAVHAYPLEIKATNNGIDNATNLANDGAAFRANQFQADLGIVSLSRGDYAQALSALLRSGFWRDAAYVAERVMTADELRAYVRGNFPQAPARVPEEPAASPTPEETPTNIQSRVGEIKVRSSAEGSANPAAHALRYLLARRLARDGWYAEARPYYPEPLWPKFDEYVAALRLGQNDRQPKSKRADAFWRAAKIERWLGMELFGTEDDPDWLVEDGDYDDDHYREARAILPKPLAEGDAPQASPTPAFVPPVGADEKRRASRHVVRPEKRYHYRYLAADLAWQAAALMADQQEETARVLAAGGLWLESVDEGRAADRFYLALLRRCGRTDLGREADKNGGIPRIEHEDP